jgi:hypothetical protein
LAANSIIALAPKKEKKQINSSNLEGKKMNLFIACYLLSLIIKISFSWVCFSLNFININTPFSKPWEPI